MPNAIVTGASEGLGLALTRQLSSDGWTVAVDARGAEQLHTAVDALPGIVGVPGDVTDPDHLVALAAALDGDIDLVVNNAGALGPSPLPALRDWDLALLEKLYVVNVLAPLALVQITLPRLAAGAAIVNVTSDAAIEAYEGWGGYGSSKAALEQVSAVLAVEHPELRVYAVDPGDMRTAMHQRAFPGEDISDRPPPEDSVPGLLALIASDRPSGRYRAAEVFV